MENVVFYDGECGFCNRAVQFVLTHEKDHRILFTALQSDFCKKFFEEHHLAEPDYSTFYFYSNNQLYQKSRAALRVIPFLKWYWQPLRIFVIFPKFFTDLAYNFIAERRKRIGGTFCVIPSAENKKRFLE